MRLVLATFTLAVVVGLVTGGRVSGLGRIYVRWAPVALVGLAMQFAPLPGRFWPMTMLYVSFVLLLAFAVVNLRTPGFVLILIGISLNFTVILANNGMPVSRHALVASGQQDTLTMLIESGGAKHHLATDDDRVLFLGDVIALRPIEQAISVGDIFAYMGVAWLIVASMRRREDAALPEPPEAIPEATPGAAHAQV
jgi:hypothetical protein